MRKINFEELLSILLADLLTRFLYFSIIFSVLYLFIIPREFSLTDPGMLICLALGGFTALVGPAMYTYDNHTGRGTLKKIKKASEQRKTTRPSKENSE